MSNIVKNALLLGLAAAAVTAPVGASAAPLQTWYGRYVWQENLGRIGGNGPRDGVVAFTTYTLRLGPNAGPTGCLLTGEGYQLDERLKCTATPEIDSVVIKFFTLRGPYVYPQGAKLFTMTRTNRGIVTRLQALHPNSDATPIVGRLFRPLR